MRRILTVIGVWLLCGPYLFGQYANDWIDYDPDRYYLELRITKDGLYRVSSSTWESALSEIGLDLTDVDPRSIQVFGRGQEQYIHVEGESDGSFDSGDYIEFFGQGNDGWADESLYPSSDEHTNPHYSLFNDTASYYITWDPNDSASSFRYETIGLTTPSGQSLSYVWSTARRFYNNVYQKGEDLGGGVPPGFYVGGKGWMSGKFGYNNGNTPSLQPVALNTPHAYSLSGAPQATLEVALSGINQGAGGTEAHHVEIALDDGGGYQIIDDVIYGAYEYVRISNSIPSNDLGTTSTVRLQTSTSISPLSTTSDYSACAYMELTYPRSLNLDGESSFAFEIPANGSQVNFLASDFSTSTTTHLYDLGQHKRFAVDHNTSTGSVQCNLDPGTQRQAYLAAESAINTVNQLTPVGGSGKFDDPSDWEVANAYIIITHSSLIDEANDYASYRASDYNTVVIDIETLYDQFSFGIRKNPSSIRNFIDWATQNWATDPSQLFIIGKSIEEQTNRKNANHQRNTLVPSMGYPVSDVLITAGLNGELDHVPAIPTGRLAAREGAEVTIYLNKVRGMEQSQNTLLNPYTIGNRQWQKRILHFAGGDDASENNRFKGYLSQYTEHIVDSLFGGEVFLFSKTSGNVIEQLNTDSVRQLIKEGSAIMTFFGHASGNTFDLSVDDPTQWDNTDRYPAVIANSCFSGNIHLPVNAIASVSEQYVLTPNEGAIAFIATPDLSFESTLNSYTRNLYRHIANTTYGGTLGEQMKATCADLPNDIQNASIAIEMTLHGDPALRLYPHDKSELTINDPQLGADIRIKPNNVTTDLDSFDVVVTLTNLGRSTQPPFSVAVTRILPDQQESLQAKEVNIVHYEREVTFRFPTNPEAGTGLNRLVVEVDQPLDLVDEEIESVNNIVTNFTFNISSSDVFPVFPYDFGVIPDLKTKLRANTGFPILDEASYTFQLDTTDLYNSPFKKETTITQSGAVIEWDPELALEGFADSTVFFWRVTLQIDTTKWREFSFQVIDGARGWGQDHFFQYKNNDTRFIELNRTSREMQFTSAQSNLSVNVVGNPVLSSTLEVFATKYTIDGEGGEYGIAPDGVPSMAITVIDSATLEPWGTYGIENGQFKNLNHQFGNSNNYNPNTSRGRRVEYWFSFGTTNQNNMNSMLNMITNEVPDGHYLLAYTLNHAAFQDTVNAYWDNTAFGTFEALGADSIRYIPNRHPYIFFARKGHPETAIEVIGQADRDIIKLNALLETSLKFGEVNGPRIGPAMDWSSFHFSKSSLDASLGDSTKAEVYASDNGGIQTLFTSRTTNGVSDLSGIAIDSFAYLDLQFATEDNVFSTPGQLRNWHVLYDPAPDAAINPLKGQTLQPGAEILAGGNSHFGFAIENISAFSFGAFRVHYWLTDKMGETVIDEWVDYASLGSEEVIFDSILIPTEGLNGAYTAYMEVNPKGQDWHREQYSFNNRVFMPISVTADVKNPLLDVTFDGIHILNGDIVSPTPEIVMELKDDNALILMEDTTSFDVYLRYPNGFEQRIPYFRNGTEVMFFEPATNQDNKARLTYKPQQALQDGTHTLRVSGQDASGNKSGDEDYKIDFEVINRSTVTQVVNYPNPFSTSTRFVFTLTGSVIPDVFTIQILTVTGKVMREITIDEIGPINIGRNVSEYAWDGRDEYGDQLANGVYMYTVIMKIDGESIERRETSADQFFTKEFGKMYLLR